MMAAGYQIKSFDLVMSLSRALDLVSPEMANHHKRVAYIAVRIAGMLSESEAVKQDLVVASALHDIGVLSHNEEIESSLSSSSHHSARFGYELLRQFEPFKTAAEIIRFHHVPWEFGAGEMFGNARVHMASHILHLANAIDAELSQSQPIFRQVATIRNFVEELRGAVFVPDYVDAFLQLSDVPAFWLDLDTPGQEHLISRHVVLSDLQLDLDELLGFAELWAHVIDFRSRYTSTHSSGVAACAEALGRTAGLSADVCKKLKIAGYLHDIGKLAIPLEILDKPGPLSGEERLIINTHAYHSHGILSSIKGFEEIADWCGFHHERLDGSGYPYRLRSEMIPLEVRVLAVADVVTALTENRPYRKSAGKRDVMRVLKAMSREGVLDGHVVEALSRRFEYVNTCRREAQVHAVNLYERFINRLKELDLSWAKGAHLAWKKRLRAHLNGRERIEVDTLLCHSHCALGRWYYTEGMFRYRHIPEMHQLETPHQELHRKVAKAIELAGQNRTGEAEELMLDVEFLSVEIVRLLETIESSAWRLKGEHAHTVSSGIENGLARLAEGA